MKRGRDLLQRTFSFSDAHAVALGISSLLTVRSFRLQGRQQRCLPLAEELDEELAELHISAAHLAQILPYCLLKQLDEQVATCTFLHSVRSSLSLPRKMQTWLKAFSGLQKRCPPLPRQLDEGLATLHLPARGSVLTVDARSMQVILLSRLKGPFRSEHLRY